MTSLSRNKKMEMSKSDLLFMEKVSQSTTMIDGHYCTGLSLKNKDVEMPNNRSLAEQRALYLRKKFLKNPLFHHEYVNFMKDVITMGYAVKVTKPQP